MKQCTTCQNKAEKNRTVCGTCRIRRYRAKKPLYAAYMNLRNNARRRQHAFHLTFDDFKAFCIKTDYIVRKGKTVDSFSIDRIDNGKGYEIGNLQVLTLGQNSQKHTKKVVFDYETRDFYTVTINSQFSILNSQSCPF